MASQKIKQADIFGRIGSGIGKGLSEQIPKEIERSRLSSGLKELEGQQDLSPFQQFSRLAAIPGITPQMIQSGAELLRQQSIRNSFQNQNTSPSANAKAGEKRPGLEGVKFGNFDQSPKSGVGDSSNKIPSDFANRTDQAKAGQGIVNENPIQDKFLPKTAWTPTERDEDIGREATLHPELPFDQIVARSADNERRYLAAPETYRQQQEYLKKKELEAEQELDQQLSTALQKEGNDVYKDLTGTNILNAKKAMYNDLATDPEMTPKKAAEKWQNTMKDFVKAKNIVKEKANRDIADRIQGHKKEETVKSLKAAQKIYDQMGAKDEFYNTLRSDFGLSPGYGALIAYPRSEGLKEIVKKNPLISSTNFRESTPKTKKIAQEFAKNRTSSDSILAFARNMKDKYPFFDETAFFDYLRENQDDLKFTPDQKNELITGVSDMFRNWGDLALFPLTGRSVAHD